jgi:hypothetical protein
MNRIFILIVLGLVTALPVFADSVDNDIALLRSDISKDKVSLITANMAFTPEEAGAFWPVYKQYDAELSKIGDERVALIKDYAANQQNMTDAKARELTDKWLDTEEKRLALKKKYMAEFEKVLSAKTTARFLQVENRINMLLDLQVASAVPLVTK